MSPAETGDRSVGEAKRLLRERMRSALSSVPDRTAQFAGNQIAEMLESTPEWQGASRIALYSSLPGEVDTRPIWDAARRASKSVLFPRVIPGSQLEFATVEEVGQLEAGRFNVFEPKPGCPVSPLDGRTLVLVPGLAFDRKGNRLGRGAGYYDRALSSRPETADASASDRPHRFGIGFELQIVPSVPMGRYDVKMDRVWTECGQRPLLAEYEPARTEAAQSKEINEETDPE